MLCATNIVNRNAVISPNFVSNRKRNAFSTEMINRNRTVLKLFIFFILPFKLQKIRGFSYAKNPEGW